MPEWATRFERTRGPCVIRKTLENRRFYADCFHLHFTIADRSSGAPKQVQNRVPNGMGQARSCHARAVAQFRRAILFLLLMQGLLRL